jgi:hypothetical protein
MALRDACGSLMHAASYTPEFFNDGLQIRGRMVSGAD